MTAATPPRWDLQADIVHARRASLGLTMKAVTQAGGPSDALLSRIEADRWAPTRGVTTTLTKLDTALQWEPGSAAHIIAGHPPRELIPTTRPAEHHTTPASTAIENELDAIRIIARVLDALPTDARARALAWTHARYQSTTDADHLETHLDARPSP